MFESGLARGPIETVPADLKLLGWEYTKDFTPLIPRGIGITAGAASPDSAKLFLDFVFSNQGQQVLCDAGFEASSNTFTPAGGYPEHAQGPLRGGRRRAAHLHDPVQRAGGA